MNFWKQHDVRQDENFPENSRKRKREEITDTSKKVKYQDTQEQLTSLEIQRNEYIRTKDCNFLQEKSKNLQENIVEKNYDNNRYLKPNEILKQLHYEKMNRSFEKLNL
jgi:hypothetical protein